MSSLSYGRWSLAIKSSPVASRMSRPSRPSRPSLPLSPPPLLLLVLLALVLLLLPLPRLLLLLLLLLTLTLLLTLLLPTPPLLRHSRQKKRTSSAQQSRPSPIPERTWTRSWSMVSPLRLSATTGQSIVSAPSYPRAPIAPLGTPAVVPC